MKEINRDGYIFDGNQALKALGYSDSEIKRLFAKTVTGNSREVISQIKTGRLWRHV